MIEEFEESSVHEGFATPFHGDKRQRSKIHPKHFFSDFPPFRTATDNMEHWPDLLSGSATESAGLALMTHISLVTLCELADPATHHTVTFDDLVETAKIDLGAFECLRHLVIQDLRRPGPANATLRAWAASYIDGQTIIPSKKKGARPHMAARGIFLATLIAQAEREGFKAHRNKASKGEQKPSGCEIVEMALRKEKWQHVPTVAALESVWQRFQNFVARSGKETKRRSLSELGVHPESLLAVMARHPF